MSPDTLGTDPLNKLEGTKKPRCLSCREAEHAAAVPAVQPMPASCAVTGDPALACCLLAASLCAAALAALPDWAGQPGAHAVCHDHLREHPPRKARCAAPAGWQQQLVLGDTGGLVGAGACCGWHVVVGTRAHAWQTWSQRVLWPFLRRPQTKACAAWLPLHQAGCTMEEIVEAAKSANAHNFISGLPRG